MYDYDPMKDDSASSDRSADRPGTDSGGRGYTNPDGSHGFIYNDRAAEAEIKSRRYRGALIAVSAVLATILLATCCFLGAFMAARSLRRGDGNATPDGAETPSELGTSDGLVIADETGNVTAGTPSSGTTNGDKNTPGGQTPISGDAVIPTQATIHKLPAKRTDSDGDGRPDVELDEHGEVLTSAGDGAVSVATVVARVASSVVEITTETLVQSGFIGQYVTGGAGSGVIVSAEGFIVTNHHVIDGANTITVRLNDGTEYPATLVGTDEQTDIAILWIDAGDRALTVATLGSSYDLVVGEDILAIGNPLGSLGGTVTEGMVSATARQISVSGTNMTLLQISAPINPGNSGGGLFNLAGELVGVVNAKMSSEEIEGLAFAIPVDTAYDVILELIAYGYVRGRPALGASVIEMLDWGSETQYVYVNDKNHATLQYGDIILAADGTRVNSLNDLEGVIRGKSIGDTVELVVYRNRQQIKVAVTVVEYIPAPVA